MYLGKANNCVDRKRNTMGWEIFLYKGETDDNHKFLPEGFCVRVAVDCCREITLACKL